MTTRVSLIEATPAASELAAASGQDPQGSKNLEDLGSRRPSSRSRQRWAWRTLAAWLPAGLALLTGLYDLGAESFWLDEASSVWIATRPWAELWPVMAGDPHPPLYYLILKLWIEVFGASEVAVRLPSVIASVLAVIGLTRWLSRAADERLVLLAGGLLALSGLHVHYAQEARPYALLACLAVWATDRLWVWHTQGGRGAGVLYALVATALAYTHVGGLFVLTGHGLWWVWVQRMQAWRAVWVPLAVALAYGPRWPTLLSSAGWACAYCQPPSLSAVAGTVLISLGSFMALACALTFLGLALYVRVRQRTIAYTLAPGAISLLACIAVAVQAIPLLVSLRGDSIYLDRVTIGGVFALVTLVALGLLHLPRALTVLAAGALVTCQGLGLIFGYYLPVMRDDWRDAVALVSARQPAGTVAFVYPANTAVAAEVYSAAGGPVWHGLAQPSQLTLGDQISTWVIWADGSGQGATQLAEALPPGYALGEAFTLRGLDVVEIRSSPTER